MLTLLIHVFKWFTLLEVIGGSSSYRAMAPMPCDEAEGECGQVTFTISQGYEHHWEIPDAVARQTLINLGMAGDRRNRFALCIYPYRTEYGSLGLWQRKVGKWVARDIKYVVELRDRMCKLHYKPRATGYTMEQMIELVKYYLWKRVVNRPPNSLKG